MLPILLQFCSTFVLQKLQVILQSPAQKPASNVGYLALSQAPRIFLSRSFMWCNEQPLIFRALKSTKLGSMAQKNRSERRKNIGSFLCENSLFSLQFMWVFLSPSLFLCSLHFNNKKKVGKREQRPSFSFQIASLLKAKFY